ncbi:hypothetical protein RD792_007357 [Penstemon davidsonii]|uniref:Pectinesterase n=1 Tax=Penstemon davidsonii TaxID=160366 RepID=A0ABR0D7Y7_9LAMI|nr:hypothetical protein RD792_007357 [Penstemon davidsonii]
MHVRGVERRVQDKVIVVDKSGRGDSVTVQGAVDMVPEQNTQRVKIQILPGIYSEKVHVPASKPYISFIGDPELAAQTVITWHDKASDRDINGGLIGTWNSSSVIVESDYFCASYITFQNTVVEPYGGLEGYQAVALRISGDKAVFHKVRFLGSQDTLLDESGSHLFYRCFIQGATDFIFGNAKSLYQECAISVVGPAFAIAAHHRNSENEDTGFSFVNCNVTVGGWQDWGSTSSDNTVVFGEYQCRGIGANRSGRVPYSKELNYIEAKPYLDRKFINEEQWLRF